MKKETLYGLNLRVYINSNTSMVLNRRNDETPEDAISLIDEVLRNYKKLLQNKNFDKLNPHNKLLLLLCLMGGYEINIKDSKIYEILNEIEPTVEEIEQIQTKVYLSDPNNEAENLEFCLHLDKKEENIKVDFYSGICRIEKDEIENEKTIFIKK